MTTPKKYIINYATSSYHDIPYEVCKFSKYWGVVKNPPPNTLTPHILIHFCKPYKVSACNVITWMNSKKLICYYCSIEQNDEKLNFMLKFRDLL